VKIPRIEAGPAEFGRRADPGDMGSGAGALASGQAAKELGQITLALFEQEMSSKVAAASASAGSELNDLRLEVEQEPDHHKRSELYSTGSKKITDKFRQGLMFPKYKSLYDSRISKTLNGNRLSVAQSVRQSQIDSSRADRRSSIENFHDQYKNTIDESVRKDLRDQIHEQWDEGVEGGLWTADYAAQQKIISDNRFETEHLITQSQIAADEIMDEESNPNKRVALARKRYTGVMRDQVVTRLEHRNTEELNAQVKAHNVRKKQLILQAYKEGPDRLTREAFMEIAAREKLPSEVISPVLTAIKLAETRANPLELSEAEALKAQLWETNSQRLFFQLMGEAQNFTTRPHFLRRNLWAEYGAHIDDKLLQKLLAEQGEGTAKLGVEWAKRIERKMAQLGLPVTAAQYAEESEKVAESENFRARALTHIEVATEAKGLPLTETEVQGILDVLGDKIVIDEGHIFDTTIRRYQVTPETEVDWPDDATEQQIRDVHGLGNRDDVDALELIRKTFAEMVFGKSLIPLPERYKASPPQQPQRTGPGGTGRSGR